MDNKKYFVLKNNTPVEVENYFLWKENPNHEVIIAAEPIHDIVVQTKFIGLTDKNDAAPRLFSTRVIGDNREVLFYETYDQAMNGHTQVCKELMIKYNLHENTGGIS